MKLVVNCCFGGFSLNRDIAKKLGVSRYDSNVRNNEELIALIESGMDCNGYSADLQVVEFPDNCTDYEISDYDGCETVIYVVDGKIHHI